MIETLLQMAQITVQGVVPFSPSSEEATSSRRVAERLTKLTRDFLGCQRVGLVEVEPETERQQPLAVVGLTPEQEQRWWADVRQQETRFGEGLPPALVERLRHNEVLLFDLREPPWNEVPNPYGIVTMLLAPLCLGTRVVGLLSLDYGPQEHTYTSQEIGLTQAVTQLLAIAIERERLQQTNQRLTDLIAFAHDAIIVRTLDGSITFWNQGAEQLYGWSAQQVLGQDLHNLLHTQFPVSRNVVETELAEQGSWEGELVQTRHDGVVVTVESRKVLVREQDQRAIAVLEINRDIMERTRLLAERAEAQASAQAARETSRLMDEFIGIAGHELRTPLTTIKASIQLTKRQVARVVRAQETLPTEATSLLQQIDQHLERAERQIEMENRLVSDLLDISRLHANQFEVSVALCDLGQLVREVVEDQRILTPTRLIHLSLPDDEDVLVLADRDRLRQVVSNYLTNALKYSDACTPVRVSLLNRSGEGRVQVSDQGPGLSVEEQQRIWTQFYRVKNIGVKNGSATGLGLGLYICKAIIEWQGGQVGVESQVGVGSTFWFALPLADHLAAS
jgi:PAS domain S-box-containing protein